MRGAQLSRVALTVVGVAAVPACAAEGVEPAEPRFTGGITGYYYSMRDQPDFGVGVATLDRGALHLEARYNYEVHNAGSAFVGWKFSGGDELSFEATPILGAMFGAARGAVPGFEASIGWRDFDAYIEAEYVHDLNQSAPAYYYAWSELGWKPLPWLRVGLVGQRTREVETGRDLQRGVSHRRPWRSSHCPSMLSTPTMRAATSSLPWGRDSKEPLLTLGCRFHDQS